MERTKMSSRHPKMSVSEHWVDQSGGKCVLTLLLALSGARVSNCDPYSSNTRFLADFETLSMSSDLESFPSSELALSLSTLIGTSNRKFVCSLGIPTLGQPYCSVTICSGQNSLFTWFALVTSVNVNFVSLTTIPLTPTRLTHGLRTTSNIAP